MCVYCACGTEIPSKPTRISCTNLHTNIRIFQNHLFPPPPVRSLCMLRNVQFKEIKTSRYYVRIHCNKFEVPVSVSVGVENDTIHGALISGLSQDRWC